MPFIKVCFLICDQATIEHGVMSKFKIALEIFQVALIGASVILEVFYMLEYVQGTRLALISYNKVAAAALVFMCITKCKSLTNEN